MTLILPQINRAVLGPPVVSGLTAWYDFSNAGSLTIVSGAMSAGKDLTGNGYDLSQSTAGKRASFVATEKAGLSALAFNAANTQFYSVGNSGVPLATANAFSVFMVGKRIAPVSGTPTVFGLINDASSSPYQYPIWWGTDSQIYTCSASYGATTAGQADSGYTVFCATSNGTNGLNIYKNNGSNIANAPSGSSRPAINYNYFGAGRASNVWSYANGYMGEYLIYNSVLSSAARTAVFNYLRSKWKTA